MKKLLAILIAFPLMASAAADRVVALGGDITEIVYALGAGKSLVARDSTSLAPSEAKSLPDVGYLRQLNAEGILAMRPDRVLASDQAQPSLALQQIQRSGVAVTTIPGSNDINAIDSKIRLSQKPLAKWLRVNPCASKCVSSWRVYPPRRSINACCLSLATAG